MMLLEERPAAKEGIPFLTVESQIYGSILTSYNLYYVKY